MRDKLIFKTELYSLLYIAFNAPIPKQIIKEIIYLSISAIDSSIADLISASVNNEVSPLIE